MKNTVRETGEENMKPRVKIDGEIPDLLAVKDLLPARQKKIKNAPATRLLDDPINDLARHLHPERMNLVIDSTRKETPTIKSFRLVPDPDSDTEVLPMFRAGQYVSVKEEVEGVWVTRPYSISSSPLDAVNDGYIELTIRQTPGGFFTNHVWNNWKKGRKLVTSGPGGFFYHDDLRDTKDFIGLAGGCGFTPFRSMIRDIIQNDLDMKMTLLFGITKPTEIIFKKELQDYAKKHPDKFAIHYVCSEPTKTWKGPSGFLTRGLIKELAGDIKGKSIFVCGPPAMYQFLEKELKPEKIPARRIRREVFGEIKDVTAVKGFPKKLKNKTFELLVNIGNETFEIQAAATETVLVAMERAGLAPPSQCRSGECGFCDSILKSGEIFVSPENDGRREASKKYNHFHPCSSYPLSNLEIKVMRDI